MIVKCLAECPEFEAGDKSALREIFNPRKDDLELGYSLAQARVKPGQTTARHKLKSSEVYYILEGVGEISIDGETRRVSSGQAIYIPPGSEQHIRNIGKTELVFLCLVDPAWQAGDEEILE